MTLRAEKPDLVTVPQGYYLAHCISGDYALGAGIARRFDEIYNMRYKLHGFFPTEVPEHPYQDPGAYLVDNVFNLVTKQRHFHKPTYDSLKTALLDMRRQMEEFAITKLAMPRIGCGLDKLEWPKVRTLIEEVFGDMDVEILICSL